MYEIQYKLELDVNAIIAVFFEPFREGGARSRREYLRITKLDFWVVHHRIYLTVKLYKIT